MLVGLLVQVTISPHLVGGLPLVEVSFLGHQRNKHVFLIPQWNHSL